MDIAIGTKHEVAVTVTKEITAADGSKYQEYILCYGTEDKCSKLGEGEATSTLLINASGNHVKNSGAEGMITFKNIIEGQGLENVVLKLDVESYAIQTSNLTKDNSSVPSDVWNIIMNQTGN